MGKRTSQLTQLTAAQVAQGDFLPIVDVSAGQTKYVTVKDLTGLPDFGWSATGESWAYSSYNATTRTGVITVPTDATTKYTKGMRVRFSQTTGGTKHGIIVDVLSTALHVFFESGKTLANEAITSPVYSSIKTPFGFPADPNNWKLEYTNASDTNQTSPTPNTWYNPGSQLLTLPRGAWALEAHANAQNIPPGGGTGSVELALSTSASSVSDGELHHWQYVSPTSHVVSPMTFTKMITLTADTTYYFIAMTTTASAGTVGFRINSGGKTRISAYCAYL